MTKRLLIDARQTEETRVITSTNDKIDDFEYEVHSRRQLKGNIYLARVTRVEPSLQAAFVEYGGNRQGFLAFSEIHPDYYRIPIEDRKKLIADVSAKTDEELDINQNINEEIEEDFSEEELRKVKRNLYRNYKIQEVIARRQILLVQVVKEERGTKGAALTTYISIAGRYCVLMPNTPRGGGVSRKIANIVDRKRLKKIVDDLDLATGMALIIRTAGSKRTKIEIKRDYSNSISTWENVKKLTLESNAPTLIHEEGSLVKRAIRDLYHNDIDEVLVEGNEAYKVCKNYMKALMPSHAKKVQEYHDEKKHLFQRYNLDSQLFDIFSPKVTLNSGGYLIIDQTEALVAIDVNSGKATRERSIEDTALKTNLEAAEEFARQARLRDLSGLVVIDFIDMEEVKNRNNVEKKLKEAMRKDRARIQIGQISSFGLLELSRQRLRPSVVENSSELCSHCGGSGRIQSIEVSAVQILRSIEEEGADDNNIGVNVYAHSSVILHILNKKRDQLSEIQSRYNIMIEFINDNSIIPPLKKLETVKKINTQNKIQTEKKENQEGSAINDQENNNRRKRGKKIGRRNKKVIPNEDLSNEEETKNNNQINKSETKATDKTDQNEINKNIKKRKNTPENYKKSNESKSKKTKSVKIKSKNDNTLDDEKNNINETSTTETKNPRIVQTSSPIEVTKIDSDSKPQKPKRKGWWSK
ncbi:ribonuclease E/G [Alphaproteobacteria bacterium]|nr:ribonuclease E/G [Alphaproteobacteria bacterium]MDC3273124.1 ribonuclease E/G [Alphaproteobacteria bacterium]